MNPPGYKYFGPFNRKDNGDPVDHADHVAREHDQAYEQYLNQGKNPYLYFNQADQTFLDDLNQHNDPSVAGIVGRVGFGLKKLLFPHMTGEQSKLTDYYKQKGPGAGKQPRDKDQARRGYFANQARQRQNQLNQNRNMGDQGGDEMDQGAAPVQDAAMPAAGGATGGGGGGGGGGIGTATGGIDSKNEWYQQGDELIIVARCARHCIIKQDVNNRNNIYYFEKADDKDSERDSLFYFMHEIKTGGIVHTPWGFIDCNNLGCFFNPQEWQWIANNCDDIVIKEISHKIHSIVIKNIVQNDAGTTNYNNDLTASMMIAQDNNCGLPYVCNGLHGEGLGYRPWEPNQITHYRYWSRTTTDTIWQYNSTTKKYTHRSVNHREPDNLFFIEDCIPISQHRTGDTWQSGTYTFKTKPWNLNKYYGSSNRFGLPPISLRPETDRGGRFGRYNPDTQDGHIYTTGIGEMAKRPSTTVGWYQPINCMQRTMNGLVWNPGPETSEFVEARPGNFNNYCEVVDYAHGYGMPTKMSSYTNHKSEFDKAGVKGPGYRCPKLGIDDGSGEALITQATNDYNPWCMTDRGLPDYPNTPIWEYVPDADIRAHSQRNAMFTIFDKPPGQTLIKLAPQYTPFSHSGDPDGGEQLANYGQFIVEYTAIFKCKTRGGDRMEFNMVDQLNGDDWIDWDHNEGVLSTEGSFGFAQLPTRATWRHRY